MKIDVILVRLLLQHEIILMHLNIERFLCSYMMQMMTITLEQCIILVQIIVVLLIIR